MCSLCIGYEALGLREELYRQAREKGVHFVRYDYDRH